MNIVSQSSDYCYTPYYNEPHYNFSEPPPPPLYHVPQQQVFESSDVQNFFHYENNIASIPPPLIYPLTSGQVAVDIPHNKVQLQSADSSSSRKTSSTKTASGKYGISKKTKKPKNVDSQMRQRNAANQRERRRMENLNTAYENLRHSIRPAPYEKRLSKVDTLRKAIEYIKDLQDLLSDMPFSVAGGRSSKCLPPQSSSSSYSQPIVQKIIVRPDSTNTNYCLPSCENMGFMGHSLSWTRTEFDEHTNGTDCNNFSFKTKVWYPSMPNVN